MFNGLFYSMVSRADGQVVLQKRLSLSQKAILKYEIWFTQIIEVEDPFSRSFMDVISAIQIQVMWVSLVKYYSNTDVDLLCVDTRNRGGMSSPQLSWVLLNMLLLFLGRNWTLWDPLSIHFPISGNQLVRPPSRGVLRITGWAVRNLPETERWNGNPFWWLK